jgi:alcohol-forming fatty acyl-CoA reductase
MTINSISQALVHVSTAYCNCDRSDVAETIYAPPYSPDDIISLVQWLPEDLLDKVREREQTDVSHDKTII